jgi:hypothetical protein
MFQVAIPSYTATYLKSWCGILEQRLADTIEIYWQIRSLHVENCAQHSLIHDQVQEIGLLFQKSEEDGGVAEYSVFMWFFRQFVLIYFSLLQWKICQL